MIRIKKQIITILCDLKWNCLTKQILQFYFSVAAKHKIIEPYLIALLLQYTYVGAHTFRSQSLSRRSRQSTSTYSLSSDFSTDKNKYVYRKRHYKLCLWHKCSKKRLRYLFRNYEYYQPNLTIEESKSIVAFDIYHPTPARYCLLPFCWR